MPEETEKQTSHDVPANEKKTTEEHGGHMEKPTCSVDTDVERQQSTREAEGPDSPKSAIKGLSWLDRLLALWILLAMIIGIVIGNFVNGVDSALHKGEFVGVSVPIGECKRYGIDGLNADCFTQPSACSL